MANEDEVGEVVFNAEKKRKALSLIFLPLMKFCVGKKKREGVYARGAENVRTRERGLREILSDLGKF